MCVRVHVLLYLLKRTATLIQKKNVKKKFFLFFIFFITVCDIKFSFTAGLTIINIEMWNEEVEEIAGG